MWLSMGATRAISPLLLESIGDIDKVCLVLVKLRAVETAVERILGAATGSLHMYDYEQLRHALVDRSESLAALS